MFRSFKKKKKKPFPSVKRNPFVANHLLNKIEKLNAKAQKDFLKTWSRASTIIPAMIGYTLFIHNGREHVPIPITKYMVNYKLGDFVPTRIFNKPTSKSKSDTKSVKSKSDTKSVKSKRDTKSRS
uniref:Small ribosomal subunit protein uS19c n=4 Tax=Pelargonium TaxID=4030 RepID=A0A1B0PWK6_9ROSI|nr:ribosomal protein S19 [Pelargonium myrrhifolium]YP_009299661.1 ribosomal protein S19 [Pelargonium myrrhifolium]AJB99548.1 ribosomal protein S19 [Pelargonium myrrhifolium]AJB99576.1 ribosomal protein S19 [Pelargonium myrrhifolium]